MGEPVFKGIDGTELEAFMLHVRRLARSEGKLRDKEWLLDIVTANLAEGALRWFESLEEEQQNDWMFVKKALYEKYPAPSGRDVSPSVTRAGGLSLATPVDFAVAPPQASSVPFGQLVRLKLVSDSRSPVYVSRKQKEGLHIATSVPSDQDVFQFDTRMVNSVRTVSLQWERDSDLRLSQFTGWGSTRASLCTVATVFPNRLINSDNNPRARAAIGVWKLLDNRDVEVWLIDMVPDGPLQVLVKREDIILLTPLAAEQLCANEDGWEKVVRPADTLASTFNHAVGIVSPRELFSKTPNIEVHVISV